MNYILSEWSISIKALLLRLLLLWRLLLRIRRRRQFRLNTRNYWGWCCSCCYWCCCCYWFFHWRFFHRFDIILLNFFPAGPFGVIGILHVPGPVGILVLHFLNFIIEIGGFLWGCSTTRGHWVGRWGYWGRRYIFQADIGFFKFFTRLPIRGRDRIEAARHLLTHQSILIVGYRKLSRFIRINLRIVRQRHWKFTATRAWCRTSWRVFWRVAVTRF